jgi:hypothetical protein
MTSLQHVVFTSFKWLLVVLFIACLTLAILDEALKFFRGRYNTEGTVVNAFALYEKFLPTPRSLTPIVGDLLFPKRSPGWELVDHYQNNFECAFWRSRKQSNWDDERERKRNMQQEKKPVWLEAELPLERYRCVPSPIFYPAGQGWGLF